MESIIKSSFMHAFLLSFLILGVCCLPFRLIGQSGSQYNILKTNNAYVIKTDAIDYTRINTERLSLDCSSTSLSQELNFDKIASYFDDESKTIFRNIKIQARVYIDIFGEIRDLYFICDNDPEKHGVDFARLEKAIRRRMKVEENKDCLPKFEEQYVSWYIPLYQF